MRNSSGAQYTEVAGGVLAPGNACFSLKDFDAVIFDVDGVLVEVSESFRQVISLTVQFYFNNIVRIPGETRLVEGEETGFFKLAGDFNNDWDLSQGAVAYGLLKLLSNNGAKIDMEKLRETGPSVEQFTTDVKKRGGGLKRTIELIKERLGEHVKEKFLDLYKPELVKRIFMEIFAGPQLCKEFYGFEPQYYQGNGLIEKEQDILQLSLIERLAGKNIIFGILSGRTPVEAEHLIRKQGLDTFLKPEHIVTDDGNIPGKPDPAGLLHLARKMDFKSAVYVGDVPDDWYAVENYRKQKPEGPKIACCMVQTGTASAGQMACFYEESEVDFVAADVNYMLSAIAEALKAD